jgi:hypothetical protein
MIATRHDCDPRSFRSKTLDTLDIQSILERRANTILSTQNLPSDQQGYAPRAHRAAAAGQAHLAKSSGFGLEQYHSSKPPCTLLDPRRLIRKIQEYHQNVALYWNI